MPAGLVPRPVAPRRERPARMPPSLDPSLEEFIAAVSTDDEEIDLARAALLVARVEYPELPVEPILEGCDALAARVLARAGAHPTLMHQVRALIDVVLSEHGLHGAEDNYYDPRNSFLNDVLERKVGIPIALSILLMSVGARAGIPLAGTAVPLHFLIRILGYEPPLFIDSYRGGRLMSENDCRQMVEVLSQGGIPFHASMLKAIANAAVLTRFLTNLKLIYLGDGAYGKVLWILHRLLVLNPDQPTLLRERGLVHYQLGRRRDARLDLARYLAQSPDAPDAREIHALLQNLA
jgi:regulator of sirC expression with transglutaminase-like and TPR domain